MAHFTCVGATADELPPAASDARAGLDNVLALRGDPPKGRTRRAHRGWARLLERARRARGRRLRVLHRRAPPSRGSTPRPRCRQRPRHLKEKVDAGRRVLITQLFFHNPDYFAFVARARAIGIDGADHPRDHADHERRPDQALHRPCAARGSRRPAGARSSRAPTIPTPWPGSASPMRRCSAPSCSSRGARDPLLHAQPLALDARDPAGAADLPPVDRIHRPTLRPCTARPGPG